MNNITDRNASIITLPVSYEKALEQVKEVKYEKIVNNKPVTITIPPLNTNIVFAQRSGLLVENFTI